jgi:inhibitor of KinA sporulation pathway (predicted exonuclease)
MHNLLVVDLEATCDENNRDFPMEILEFGLALVCLKERKVVLTHQILVQPIVSHVTEFCTKLTGHTPESAENAMTLRHAVSDVSAFVRFNDVWVWGSWGDFDREMVDDQCRKHGLINPLPRQHLNLKQMYSALRMPGKKGACGLGKALRKENMKFEGREHSGVDDAFNTAKLFLRMMSSV